MELVKKIYLEASNGLENSQITQGEYFYFSQSFYVCLFLASLSFLSFYVFLFLC